MRFEKSPREILGKSNCMTCTTDIIKKYCIALKHRCATIYGRTEENIPNMFPIYDINRNLISCGLLQGVSAVSRRSLRPSRHPRNLFIVKTSVSEIKATEKERNTFLPARTCTKTLETGLRGAEGLAPRYHSSAHCKKINHPERNLTLQD